VLMSMRDNERQRLLPCAIIATETTAQQLHNVLELTRLVEVKQLAVVGSDDEAMSHISVYLE